MVCFVVAVNHVILDPSQCMETIPGDLPTFHEFGQFYMDFSILDSCIVDNAFVNIEAIDNVNYSIDSISSIVSKGLNVAIIINIIIILVLFFATSYILNKKLNLE